MTGQVTPRLNFLFWANGKYQTKMRIPHFYFSSYFRSAAPDQVWTRIESNKISVSFGQKQQPRRTLKSKDLFRASFISYEIYLGYSAATPGKFLDHLASWLLQRQPWYSQKTSIQKLQTRSDENNWRHLSPPPTQYLQDDMHYKHLGLKTKVVKCN